MAMTESQKGFAYWWNKELFDCQFANFRAKKKLSRHMTNLPINSRSKVQRWKCRVFGNAENHSLSFRTQ